ncbi:putative bifunctional diguanylate cyclase/phosphodiesterase [Parasphingorhabdus cellanae]|uniref:EAL domain-containing protein n=1 Tax=Parasphingorhabdus cellanae TaxID=2806553 RepID=A0ABX7T955_9SPHN|nr:EAL domain-containing protein [Parasphingorhabdus cellanae]QTD57528.1 EAL domain-containing protein [Parasphingorhabdus cellanae]
MIANSNAWGQEQSDQDLILREQLTEHGKSVRVTVFANLVNAAILSFLFFDQAPLAMHILWYGMFAYLSITRLHLAKRSKTTDMSRRQMLKLKRHIVFNGAGYAHMWGAGVACLLPVATSNQLMLLAIIGAGKMSTAVVSYRHIPEASRAWTIIMYVGLTAGLLYLGGIESYAAIILLTMFGSVLYANGNNIFENFANQLVAKQEIERSAETVKLLLNDFEEQASNWLFSADADGRLIDVCERFAEAAHQPREAMNGMKLISLIEDKDQRALLTDHIDKGRSFRDLTVSVDVDGEQQWWTISARAITNETEGNDHAAFRGVIEDITAQKNAEAKVSYMAHFDGLTDLPNRRLFTDTLNRTIHRASADDTVSLIFFDLDHFKAINDTLGHPIGDKLLQMISRRLEKLTKPGDLLARIGGDEFALLLTGERATSAEQVAEAIVSRIGKPFLIDDHNIVSGVSVGVAAWEPDMTDANQLLKYADLALYSAKGSGRNRVACFEKGMDVAAEARRNLELDLRTSLGRDEMRLHYQPLVDLKTQSKIGYEALLRWEHPARGVVMPDDFIGVAEETGMIVQLGEWVIRKALDDAANWDEKLTVAINLSPTQMRSASLVSTIVNALAHSGVDPGRLELEITESILMHDSETNIRTLHTLRDLGIRISLDDFGTGYSSLNYLRSFPFDKIKIDRCFVSEIDTREDCRAIIRSVINLAQNLGMTTTAEGVERQDQVEELRVEGCDQVQGFLYGKAEALQEATDLRSDDKMVPNVETIYLPAAEVPIAPYPKRKKA